MPDVAHVGIDDNPPAGNATEEGNAHGDDVLTDASLPGNDQNVHNGAAPAVSWGEPENYFFDEGGVQSAANFIDHQGKKTRLNDKRSLWGALGDTTQGVEGLTLRGSSFKIPPHVVATDTWNGALTNALDYGMMSLDEQEVERQRVVETTDKSLKRRWASMISKLHRNRPQPPTPNGDASPAPRTGDALRCALDRARARGDVRCHPAPRPWTRTTVR